MTLAAVCATVGVSEADILEYSEADMGELLKDEAGLKVIARNKVLKEWRALKAKSVVITVHARFVTFLERMGGSEALQGLEHVPLSSLPAAVSFIQGHGAPSQAELQLGVKVRAPPPAPRALHQHPGYKYAAARVLTHATPPVQRAYAKIDTLLAQGPDTWGLTRDEMAAIHLYTDDGLGGAAGCLFRPLNAALRAQGRADAKPYWGYIRLLQHALFKLPKDKSGTLYRGIKWNWPGAPPLHEYKVELQRLAATGETAAPEHEIWWGFSSTSTSLPAVESFLGQAGPRVIFTVDGGSSARDVRRYSAFQAGQAVPEDERLLPCGTAFAVKTVGSPAPDLLLVGLRQTNDTLIQGGAPPIPEGVPGMEPEPELMVQQAHSQAQVQAQAAAAQSEQKAALEAHAAQMKVQMAQQMAQAAAQKAQLEAQLKAQQEAASLALAQQLQTQQKVQMEQQMAQAAAQKAQLKAQQEAASVALAQQLQMQQQTQQQEPTPEPAPVVAAAAPVRHSLGLLVGVRG
eukprot:COSAG01_NODE_2132_length_8354_cov_19.152271_2_plen_516_part_00